MCVIIDANVAPAIFLNTDSNYEPIRKALSSKRTRVVHGGKLSKELAENNDVLRRIMELDRSGLAKQISKTEIDAVQKEIEQLGTCISNDEHIIALARVSGGRVLVTKDRDLQSDFTNFQLVASPRGKVFKYASHAHLLDIPCPDLRT